ncbi:hypothetical protein JH06_5806, partial [Blastocystis sp. subtype 4]|uniref:hypothetical protein n=1 Tax=Blastocystis sp. subtype 4 TaxID=944170 RepID=UPI0007117B8C
MAENFRPISKVLTSPAYDYDRIVVYNFVVLGEEIVNTKTKVIGNHGLMGKSFEHTYYHYSGTDCLESNFRYAERYFYEYKSEEVVDGITSVTLKTTGISIAVVGNSYNGNILTGCTLTDNEFYDVMDLTNCVSSGGDVFAYLRQQVEDGSEGYLDFTIGSSASDLKIDGIEIIDRESDDG